MKLESVWEEISVWLLLPFIILMAIYSVLKEVHFEKMEKLKRLKKKSWQ